MIFNNINNKKHENKTKMRFGANDAGSYHAVGSGLQ
jgi:hypothetical protein